MLIAARLLPRHKRWALFRSRAVGLDGTRVSSDLEKMASRGILSLLAPTEVQEQEAPRSSQPGRFRDRIAALVGIAAANGSTVSTEELRLLLPADSFTTAEHLERYIRADPILSGSLVVTNGEVAPRGAETLIAQRRQQRKLTSDRVEFADEFTATLTQRMRWVELVGVSGSTAYGGAKPEDDIDFFIVTQSHRMWVTLLGALVLARLHRLRSAEGPVLCFNRVTERDACVRSFDDGHEPLFAREALNLRILHGHGFYRELLASAPWMEQHFPSLYRSRLDDDPASEGTGQVRMRPHWSVANALAFLGLAPYLWMAGQIRNARLAKRGLRRAHFRTVIERNFCAYESRKYDELREEYRRTF